MSRKVTRCLSRGGKQKIVSILSRFPPFWSSEKEKKGKYSISANIIMVGTWKNEKKNFPAKWQLLKKEINFVQIFVNGFEFFFNRRNWKVWFFVGLYIVFYVKITKSFWVTFLSTHPLKNHQKLQHFSGWPLDRKTGNYFRRWKRSPWFF